MASVVKAVCSLCKNVAADISTEKPVFNGKVKKVDKRVRQNMSWYNNTLHVSIVYLSLGVVGRS